jgi:hypothetical protein
MYAIPMLPTWPVKVPTPPLLLLPADFLLPLLLHSDNTMGMGHGRAATHRTAQHVTSSSHMAFATASASGTSGSFETPGLMHKKETP